MNKEQLISLWSGVAILGIAVFNDVPLKVLLLIGIALVALIYTLRHTILTEKQKYALILAVLFILLLFATKIIQGHKPFSGGLGGGPTNIRSLQELADGVDEK